jgi:hypothetical protein
VWRCAGVLWARQKETRKAVARGALGSRRVGRPKKAAASGRLKVLRARDVAVTFSDGREPKLATGSNADHEYGMVLSAVRRGNIATHVKRPGRATKG